MGSKFLFVGREGVASVNNLNERPYQAVLENLPVHK